MIDTLSGQCQYDGSEEGFQEADDEGFIEEEEQDTFSQTSPENEDEEYFSENQDELMEDEQEEEYGDQLNNYEVHNIASYGQDQMTMEQQQYAQQMASL